MSGQAGTLRVSSDDGDLVASYAPVPDVQWSLALVQPESEIQAPIVHMRNLLAVAVLGLFVLVAALITWVIRREINRPIQRIVARLGKGADEVAAAASQLSNASKSLADQSTEQAASLEETTASLEEMASMTKQNADHAGEADRLMQEANQAVDDAGTCIKSLNESMTEISESSSEISRIIKTIDEIAFQTNLLALNAAVEAARAGQAGAGFAVVADEVRALAIKAADSARNTATLIEGTITKIGNGSGDLKKTVDKFKDVTSKTDKVGQLLREITAASNEQVQGIAQINKAAGEMDKTVQQNAASAEQSASASTELNVQSDAVRTVVQELESMVGLSRGLESEETAHASIRTGQSRSSAKHEGAAGLEA
ncbi:MAG: hypothetical protein HY895_14415 [Deltaproteobacteria bacterium]|nr:hypothetical protein [Deltaproteobacteria bacterium]